MSTKNYTRQAMLTIFIIAIFHYLNVRLNENKRARRLARKHNKAWLFGDKFLTISKCQLLNDMYSTGYNKSDDNQDDDIFIIDLDDHNSAVKYVREEVN